MARIRNVEDPLLPQDVATKNYVDLVVPGGSSAFAYINSVVNSGGPNTPVSTATWTKLLCATIPSVSSSFLFFDTGSPSASNRLRYIGTPNITVNASANICCTNSPAGFFIGISIYKNGVIIPSSDMYCGASNTIFTLIKINSFVRLVTNDVLEIYVYCSGPSTITPIDPTINLLQFMVSQV